MTKNEEIIIKTTSERLESTIETMVAAINFIGENEISDDLSDIVETLEKQL